MTHKWLLHSYDPNLPVERLSVILNEETHGEGVLYLPPSRGNGDKSIGTLWRYRHGSYGPGYLFPHSNILTGKSNYSNARVIKLGDDYV